MSAAQWLGIFLMAIPFVAVIGIGSYFLVREIGWWAPLVWLGSVAAVVALVVVGAMLLAGDIA